MGGSRSNKLASNKRFNADSNLPQSTLNSEVLAGSCLERMWTADSTDGQSTNSSLDNSKSRDNGYVRILGRGGAGARPRNDFKEPKSAESRVAEKKPQGGQVQLEVSIVRTRGRGGLGSRPQTMPKLDGKPKPTKDLLSRWNIGKTSKQRTTGADLTVPIDRHLNPRLPSGASERSSETLSTIHFTGERGGPPPDFFGRRKIPVAGNRSRVTEEKLDDGQILPYTGQQVRSANKLLCTLGDVPTAVLRDTLDSGLEPKAKVNRRKRLSLLLTTFKSQKPHWRESISSSSLQSDGISLTSLDGRSYFSGPISLSSHPSSVSFGTDYERTSQNLPDAMETSFSIRSSISSSSSAEPTGLEQPMCNGDISPPTISITPPTQSYERSSVDLIEPNSFCISASEAAALSRPKTTDRPFAMATEEVPIVDEAEEGTPRQRRQERLKSWTGEWNAGMPDVIQALRELR